MCTILIVEDNEQNAFLLSSLLTTLGYLPVVATDGYMGMEYARTHRPDLILMDMRLPLMSGWDLTRALRSEAIFAKTPIIAVSVSLDSEAQRRALAAGCNNFISKPFDIRELRHLIRSYTNC